MGYFKRLLNSRLASAQAERVQLVMFVVSVIASVSGNFAAALFLMVIVMLFWAAELICKAIEQRPMTVIVQRERGDEP